jgi:AcrR family transcriptional regulator
VALDTEEDPEVVPAAPGSWAGHLEVLLQQDGGRPLPAGAKGQRTRRRILLAARGLFNQRGYQRTSMAEVAAAAGLSQGAVYQYFKDRSDLVVAIILDALQGILASIDSRWTPEVERQSLEVVLTRFAATFAELPDVIRVFEEVAHVEPAIRDLRRAVVRMFASAVEEAVREGQRLGAVRDDLGPAAVAQALCAMTDRHCYMTYVFDPPLGGPPTPEETGRLLAALWRGGLGVTAPAAGAAPSS